MSSKRPAIGDEPSDTPELPSRASRRVLIVDDSEDSAEMLQVFLQELGHEVRIAFDGPSALETAAGFAPELVLLDVGLPGLSGYEVARRLRQIPSCATIPIVAVTGYSRDSDRAQADEAGFTAHMVKPLDLDRLGSIIDDMTSGK